MRYITNIFSVLDKNSSDPTYFIQQGFRNGKKTTTKNIVRIGKHSELLKITDDPLAYAKQQVEKYNEEAKRNNKVTMEVTVDFSEKIKAKEDLVSSSNLLNIGYFFLQQIYHELSIDSFFKKVTADSKITFDPNLVNRFLTYARILDPDSKLGTYDHLGSYYEQPDFGYVHILRTMDIMAAHYDEYISHLFEHSKKIIRRNTSVCYYDCSNYYVIDEEEKYDGFYAVATNLDDNAKDIIEISSNRYMIEDCFRVMKTNFSARPVFLYP